MTVQLPEKRRKHRWVTEALDAGETVVSVWPSPDDLKSESKKKRFLETIAKVGNDPRVRSVEKKAHDVYSVVFLFHLNND